MNHMAKHRSESYHQSVHAQAYSHSDISSSAKRAAVIHFKAFSALVVIRARPEYSDDAPQARRRKGGNISAAREKSAACEPAQIGATFLIRALRALSAIVRKEWCEMSVVPQAWMSAQPGRKFIFSFAGFHTRCMAAERNLDLRSITVTQLALGRKRYFQSSLTTDVCS